MEFDGDYFCMTTKKNDQSETKLYVRPELPQSGTDKAHKIKLVSEKGILLI